MADTQQLRVSVYEAFLSLLDEAIAEAGNAYRLSDILGCPPNLITRWRSRETIPRLDTIQPVIDYLGKGFGVDPTPEEIEDKVSTAKNATAKAEALARDNERLRTLVATLRGEIAALERQLDRHLNHLAPRPERGRLSDQSSTSSRKTDEDTPNSLPA